MSELERNKSAETPSREPGRTSQQQEEYFEDASLAASDVPSFRREGLPASYRRRREGHYVDELVAAGRMPLLRLVPVEKIEGGLPGEGENLESLVDSIQHFGVLQPLLVRRDRDRYELLAGSKRLAAAAAAGLKEVPCLLHEVDDVEARRLAEAANRGGSRKGVSEHRRATPAGSLVENSLHTILSTLGLLEKPESSLRDQVAIGLIRAEALRASRLLQALRLLSADPPVIRRRLEVAPVFREALKSSEDERGLLAIELDDVIDESCVIRADERLLSLAFSGAVETILALLRTTRGTRLGVEVARNELTRGVSVNVSEDTVRMPTFSWARWFDLDWEERPGGYGAGVALVAARRAVQLHGGRLEMSPTESGGCRMTLQFPAEG